MSSGRPLAATRPAIPSPAATETACRTALCVPCARLTRRVRRARSNSISEPSRAPASRTASSKTASRTSSHDSRGVSLSRMRLERSSSRVLRDRFSRSSALLSARAAMWQNAVSSAVSASLSGVSITQSTPRALSPAKSGKTTREPVPGGNPCPEIRARSAVTAGARSRSACSSSGLSAGSPAAGRRPAGEPNAVRRRKRPVPSSCTRRQARRMSNRIEAASRIIACTSCGARSRAKSAPIESSEVSSAVRVRSAAR